MRELTLRHVSQLYFKKEVKERVHTKATSLLRSQRTGFSQFEGRALEGTESASKLTGSTLHRTINYACKSVGKLISRLGFMQKISFTL